jgi:hypothetical protein
VNTNDKYRKYEGDCWGASDCKDCHSFGVFMAWVFAIVFGLTLLAVIL